MTEHFLVLSALDDGTAELILYCIVSLLVGAGTVLVGVKQYYSRLQAKLRSEADAVKDAARREAETERANLLVEAKESAMALRKEAEAEANELRKADQSRDRKLDRREEQLAQQEDGLQKQQRGLESSQTRLANQMRSLSDQKALLERTLKDQQRILEQASGMNRDEAGRQLMESMEQELENEIGTVLHKHQKHLSERVD